MDLRERVKAIFKGIVEDEKKQKVEIDTHSEIFKKAVEEAAERMVDEELKKLDKEFIRSLSSYITPLNNDEINNKSKEEQVKEILNEQETK